MGHSCCDQFIEKETVVATAMPSRDRRSKASAPESCRSSRDDRLCLLPDIMRDLVGRTCDSDREGSNQNPIQFHCKWPSTMVDKEKDRLWKENQKHSKQSDEGNSPTDSKRLCADSGSQGVSLLLAETIPADDDFECLKANFTDLDECGFYYGPMAMHEAKVRLRHAPVGTFLLRNSADPRHLFSLSVKTSRGTTSVRIVYLNGLFRLDCDKSILALMPSFRRILDLVQHYVDVGRGYTTSSKACTWLESSGRRDTAVIFTRPCRKTVFSLKQLCRTALHQSRCVPKVGDLPVELQNYLLEYPYSI